MVPMAFSREERVQAGVGLMRISPGARFKLKAKEIVRQGRERMTKKKVIDRLKERIEQSEQDEFKQLNDRLSSSLEVLPGFVTTTLPSNPSTRRILTHQSVSPTKRISKFLDRSFIHRPKKKVPAKQLISFDVPKESLFSRMVNLRN